jgi:anti-anti-sigma factor
MPLTLNTGYSGNVFMIRCTGRIVAGEELKSLDATLSLAACEFTRIVLNVENVDRMDSGALGLLVRYMVRLRKRGGDLRFAAVPAPLLALFRLTTLDALVQIYEAESEAVLSFVKHPAGPAALKHPGAPVLVLDENGDMCVFLTTILQQQGYEVISAVCLPDARILLETGTAAYIVIGPNAPLFPAEVVLRSLQSLAPDAIPLYLGENFKNLTALDAATRLLALFAVLPGQELKAVGIPG